MMINAQQPPPLQNKKTLHDTKGKRRSNGNTCIRQGPGKDGRSSEEGELAWSRERKELEKGKRNSELSRQTKGAFGMQPGESV